MMMGKGWSSYCEFKASNCFIPWSSCTEFFWNDWLTLSLLFLFKNYSKDQLETSRLLSTSKGIELMFSLLIGIEVVVVPASLMVIKNTSWVKWFRLLDLCTDVWPSNLWTSFHSVMTYMPQDFRWEFYGVRWVYPIYMFWCLHVIFWDCSDLIVLFFLLIWCPIHLI